MTAAAYQLSDIRTEILSTVLGKCVCTDVLMRCKEHMQFLYTYKSFAVIFHPVFAVSTQQLKQKFSIHSILQKTCTQHDKTCSLFCLDLVRFI